MKKTLHGACALVIGIVGASLSSSSEAQTYPAKPVKIIVNYTPGGPTDLTARTVGAKMQEYTGQAFVIDNMPSASGVIGTVAMLRAAPDGYTFMMTTAGHTSIAKALYEDKLQFDPMRDLAPISNLVNSHQALVTHPSLGVKTVAEFVNLAKAKPGQLNYGSPGIGSPNHLGLELFKSMAGLDMVHIPYKGTATLVPDQLAGRVSLGLSSSTSAVPLIRSGKLIALATGFSKRLPILPDVPTMEELGYKDYLVYTWYAFFAPAKAPPSVIGRLNAHSKQALSDPQVIATLEKNGADTAWSTPEFLGKQMRDEYERWKKVIAESKIVAE